MYSRRQFDTFHVLGFFQLCQEKTLTIKTNIDSLYEQHIQTLVSFYWA